ncbi:hypothetical protein [Pseudomonas sp. NBRC 111138]|uniref:hypothetical protein n=1 Tax=Pseudomonas sp. NBRC 111138 TaxID=1661053 RepID=UPI000B2DFAE3|nr:hypothetical protein [Pseudomonas sp. NBRC 111138]
MTKTNILKLLAEAVENVDWAWWTSNSTLRLTSENNGRHGTDGDVISAHGDNVSCPEGFRAFIEEASPANIAVLVAENERLQTLAQAEIEKACESAKEVMGARMTLHTLERERNQLRAFAVEMINCSFDGGSFEGGDIQDIAVKHRLLQIERREDECGEACACREHGFPAECYRKTNLAGAQCVAVEATETEDYDYRTDLAAYFGLSYASWLTLPRVLMEAMPEVWKRQMAALLHQYDDAYPNQPNYGTTVRLTVDGKLVKTPCWLSNYRHPDWAMVNQLRALAPTPTTEGSADAH